jgi:type IV secretory pathway VirJ component
MKTTERPGGHHFDDDFDALADIIESELRALKIF